MLRSKFLWKLYASYVALIFISTAIVGGLIIRETERDSLEEIQQSLANHAILLKELAKNSLKEPYNSVLQERIHDIGKEIKTRLTVIGADGAVIADSEKEPSGMDNHADRPEVMAARSHGSGAVTRFSNTVGTRMMYLAIPVKKDGQITGYVRASLALFTIDERIKRVRAIVALGAGVSVLVALILGFFMARGLALPITSMTSAAGKMACGDYNQRLSITGNDEISKLSMAFNQMAENCQLRMETIITDKNKLAAVLSGMVEGVVAVDCDERVLHMNSAAGRILSVSPPESVNMPMWGVIRTPDVCETIAGTMRKASEIRSELRLVVSQRDKVIEVLSSPIMDGEGTLVGAVAVLHDVSELKRLEAVRRDFVANVSHELKTPITAVRALIETLIDDKKMDAEKHERFLEKIKNQSVRLSAIVTDLIALSQLESENVNLLQCKTFDLINTVSESAKALLPVAEERDITVEIKLPESPVNIAGDEEALCQVTRNLLDNALKYTPQGGRVKVSVKRDGGYAVIEVEDTGIGIEPGERHRIFERFYRVDKARSRELGGTGLGLSIVRHILISHGGKVSVDSIPGSGSTFRVCLPLASADA